MCIGTGPATIKDDCDVKKREGILFGQTKAADSPVPEWAEMRAGNPSTGDRRIEMCRLQGKGIIFGEHEDADKPGLRLSNVAKTEKEQCLIERKKQCRLANWGIGMDCQILS
jgi:hypothetical protein